MVATFRYANPGVVHFGPGSRSALAAQLRELGASNVMLVTTRSIAGSDQVMPSLRQSLPDDALTAVCEIRQHAPRSDIEHAVTTALSAGCDGLLSVGGGSPIDAAKVVHIRAADDRRVLPHVAIPTTLSAAELAAGAGYTDERGDKTGVRDQRGMPDCVIYDAELALCTPLELWLSTGIRALDHAVEIFLSEGEHPYADALALEAFRRLMRGLPATKSAPDDVEARSDNQFAAWLSNSQPAVAAAGLSHVMGKQIGARHSIPHGVTSCLLLPHVLRFRAKMQPDRTAELARRTDCGRTGDDVADAVANLVGSLSLPQHVREYGLGEAELRAAAESLAAQGVEGRYNAGQLLDIYCAAL